MMKENPGDEAMLGKLIRGTVLVILALMVVAWALSPAKNPPPEPLDSTTIINLYV